jgi:hypothetical protein
MFLVYYIKIKKTSTKNVTIQLPAQVTSADSSKNVVPVVAKKCVDAVPQKPHQRTRMLFLNV